MIYLDYNATAPMKPAVRAAMLEAMERVGNPSSVHRYGRIARRHIEEARASVAALAGVKPAQVIFTSGGTEANVTVLRGASAVITSAIEHDSVLAVTPNAARLPVTRDGAVDLNAAEEVFKLVPAGALVSIMMVNNETGVIQPVAEIARLAKTHGHKMHTDAVQAAGRLPIDFAALGVDFLTLSAHKIGGPQGMGALIVGEKTVFQPLLKGGGQEMNRRAGTENAAGIAGFGIAAQLAADDMRDAPRLGLWRDQIERQLHSIACDDAVVIGRAAPRVANTLCVAMRGVGSETQVMAMDLAGVAVSAGAACSSGKVKASHVLRAMGYGPDIAGSALRISLGWATEEDDIKKCIEAWHVLYRRTHNNQKSKAA
jgi:cysteine desulfurase